MARTQGETDRIVMKHLEQAYKASRPSNSENIMTGGRRDSEVEVAIVDAIIILHRQGTPTTI